MKTWKTFGAVMLVPLTLATALTGCGSGGAPQSSGDNVKLTITSWRVEDTDGYKKIIKDFEDKNPNIQVTFKPEKATEYDTTLDTALKGGDAADIIQLRPYQGAAKLADAGYLEPLQGKIDGLSNISDGLADAAKGSDGKVYGVPLSVNSTQIYYNKKLFSQYNLSEPKTWDDFMKVCDTLKKNGVTPFAIGGKEGWILSLTHATLGPDVYGGQSFIDDVLAGKKKLTDPAFVASIQRMKDLQKYFPDNFMGLSANDGMALFFSEKAAMYVGGSFDMAPILKQNPNLQLDFFPVPPQSASGKPTVTTWVDGSYGVNAKSAHKDAAMKFLAYMTTKDFGQLFTDTFGRVGAVKGVEPKDPLVKKMSDMDTQSATPYMLLIYFAGGTPTTKKTLENEMQGMYLNQQNAADVAKKVQASADTWFKPKQ